MRWSPRSATGGTAATRRLGLAVAVSSVGDGVRLGSLPLLAAIRTANPVLIGAVAATGAAAVVFASLWAGVLADRAERRRLMVTMDGIRAFAMSALVIDVVVGDSSLWILFAVAALLGSATALFDVTALASVPVLAPDRYDRVAAQLNAYELTGEQLVGPALGAALFGIAAAAPFLVDACSFTASGALLTGLPTNPTSQNNPQSEPLRQAIAVGFRKLVADPLLIRLAIALSLMAFLGAANMAVLVLLVTKTLHASASGYGLTLSAGAAGAIAGSLVAPRLRVRFGAAAVLAAAVAAMATANLAIGLVTNMAQLSAAFLLNGFGAGTWSVVTVTLRLARTPQRRLGRVNSAYQLLGRAPAPLGALFGGLLAGATNPRAPFVASGLVALPLGAVVLAALHRIPQGAPQDTPH